MCTASVFSVVLIAVDQYFAVLEPLRYHSIIRKRASWQLFFISWSVSLLVGMMGVGNTFFHSAYASVYPILFSLIIFIVPFIVICYIYFCIYWAAHENSLRTRNNCSSSLFNECSNSDLRVSHDSILKEKFKSSHNNDFNSKKRYPSNESGLKEKFKTKSSRFANNESNYKKVKHESKPLLVKERKNKIIVAGGHKGVKVSKPNDLYPITSIEDIDSLTLEKKTSAVSSQKTLQNFCDGQIVMKIDARMSQKALETLTDGEIVMNIMDTEENRRCLDDGEGNTAGVEPTSEGEPLYYVTRNNNTIFKVNNNSVKMSALNRQLMSNTIVTSLSKSVTPKMFQENQDSRIEKQDSTSSLGENPSLTSISDQNTPSVLSLSQIASISDQNNSSVISLSQIDSYSLRNNESVLSLSSYNSSLSDITLSNQCMSYIMHDDLLSSYFCDKDFLASLNVHKGDFSQEPISSLKGRDHYVRINLDCYNGIENVQVVKLDDVIDENSVCDKLSCKPSLPLELKTSQDSLDNSSQSTSTNVNPLPDLFKTATTTSDLCDKNEDKKNFHSCLKLKENSQDDDSSITQNTQDATSEKRVTAGMPQVKERLFKKNNCSDDRRKQFYENERRKSNDSKCSSDDMESVTRSSQYYRNMELFQCPREKTRSIDSVASKSGLRSFQPSSTRSSLKSTSSTLVNSLKHRFSNASMFKYREESRTAKISLSVIILELLSWLPFTILLLLHSPLFNVINYTQYSSFTFEKFAILCLSFHFVGSPLLFALRNKKIKREMLAMWRSWVCFFRRGEEEKTRLRNSFYNDYHVNKQRLQALKEKQRLENQLKEKQRLENQLKQTADNQMKNQVESANPDNVSKTTDVVIGIDEESVKDAKDKTFLARLLSMKQKCCDSTKAWGNKCLQQTTAIQRSSISSNTASTSTTDVCCEV